MAGMMVALMVVLWAEGRAAVRVVQRAVAKAGG